MKPTGNTVKFHVVRSDGTPYSKVASASLQAGKFYHPTLSATLDDAIITPLTLEAIGSGTVSFLNNAAGSVYYSIDGGARTEIPAGSTGTTPTLAAGQKVAFYGDNATYTTSNNYSEISCTAGCYVYGNIMSLISSTDFPNCKTLTESETFAYLFNSNFYIYNHVSRLLMLPATTLTDECYSGMFSGCTSLTKAPDLPATTLASYCYRRMFSGCTSLRSIKCLATNISASNCTADWLSGVSATGTFTKASSMTDWTEGASGIPAGWTVENE